MRGAVFGYCIFEGAKVLSSVKGEYRLVLLVEHQATVEALSRFLGEEAADGRRRACREQAHNLVLGDFTVADADADTEITAVGIADTAVCILSADDIATALGA